jgi:putative sterol carrier protein
MSTEPIAGLPPGPAEATLHSLVKRFREEEAKDLTAVYQLRLTGDQGGLWHLTISDRHCLLAPGLAERPDVTITVAATEWVDLLAGRLDGYAAFVEGRVQVEGDLSLGLRRQGLVGF